MIIQKQILQNKNFNITSKKINTKFFYSSLLSQKYNLNKDSISFSAKKPIEKAEYSPRVKEAIGIGKKLNKLYRSNQFSYANIENIFNQNSPVPIEVKHVEELPQELKTGANFIAYMQPVYTEDFNLTKAIIYLQNADKDKTTASNIIANCVHEYTHVLQRAQDDSYIGLKKYSEDLNEARILAYVTSHTESDVWNLALRSFGIIKDFQNIKKEDIFKILPKHSEFMDYIDKMTDKNYLKLYALNGYDIETPNTNELLMLSPEKRNAIKESVIMKLEMEFEAKTSEIEAVKQGIKPSRENIATHEYIKNLYGALIEILKQN